MHKRKEWLTAIIFSIVYITCSVLLTEQLLVSVRDQEESQVKKELTLQVLNAKNTLETAIITDTYVGSSIATLATVAPQVLEQNWEVIAKQFLDTARDARSIALLPNDVVGYIYPLQGIEKAIGLDLRNVPEQYRTVEKARRTQQAVLAGPLMLVQGLEGLIIRYPVFQDFPVNQQYWGSISVVIDFQVLVKKAGLSDLDGIQIALRGKDALGPTGEIFWGNAEVFNTPDVELPINFPFGSWLLASRFDTPILAANSQLNWLRLPLYLVCFIAYVALFLFYQAYRNYRRDAYFDALTGLANRRLLMKKLSELACSASNKTNYLVINIDLKRL